MGEVVTWVSSLAQPWADLYGSSIPLETGVTFLHFAGLLVAGGFALAFDRGALRAAAADGHRREAYLHELSAVHRPVLIGLSIVVVSGFAMALADVQTLLPSWAFWLKMGLFLALLVNGAGLRRTERRLATDVEDAGGWRALRIGAVRSMALWVGTLFIGTLLTSVA